MGYLTTFTIYNDGASGIKKDPTQFVDKIDSLIGTRQYEEFHTTTGVNGFVQRSRHADEMTIYVNAGNCVTEVNPYSKSFKELIKKQPDFARELVEFVAAEVVELKKTLIKEMPIGKLNNAEKNKISKNPNSTIEVLEHLAYDECWLVRTNVARNRNTSSKILDHLANDEDSHVRRTVALNFKTTLETLDRLANDEDFGVCYHVMENKKTTTVTLDRMSLVKKYCYFVARHPNTSAETLERLSYDENCGTITNVAYNPNTPIESLVRLANNEYWEVRANVAINPNTPKETINLLLSDNREEVREAASYRINNKT